MILMNSFWILICFSILSEAFENQMKLNFIKDYMKFEYNVRFLLHVCFKIDISIIKELETKKQFTLARNPKEFLDDNEDHQMVRILDLECPHAQTILLQANSTKHFIAPNKWLLLLGPNTSAISESLLLDIDSDVITAKVYNEEIIHLKQPYKYNKYETFLVYEIYGFWTHSSGIVDQRTKKVVTPRRRNLNGYEMKQSYYFTSKDSINRLKDFKDSQIDSNQKHSFHMNKLMCYYVNATQKYRLSNSWGRLLKNGTWTGVVGRIYAGEDDVAGSGLACLGNRLPFIRYLGRISKCRVCFVFRNPALSIVSNILRMAFQTKLWISLGILLLLTMSVLKYIFTFEVKSNVKKNRKYNVETLSLQKGWASMMIFLVGSLCQQGVEKEPERISSRIGTFFLYLAMLFIYVSYSANVVALLQATSHIATLEEFVASPLKAGLLDFEFSRTVFENSSIPITREIYEKKVGPNGYYPYAKGVEKLRREKFAFYGEPGAIFHYVALTFEDSEKCNLHEVPTPGMIASIFQAAGHKSPYLEIVRTGLTRLEETGLQNRFYLRIYKTLPKCGSQVANFIPVGLAECYWAFLILAYGYGGSIFIFLIEHSLKNTIKLKSKLEV